MIKEGYAKTYNDVFCEMLPMYQKWNLQVKTNLKGSYSIVNKFDSIYNECGLNVG